MTKYSYTIMKRVRQRLGLDENDTSRDAEIESMSGYEILDHYLKWEGISGYTHNIIRVVREAFPEAADNIPY